MALLIDETAKSTALNRWALPECLHVPIAAVDEDAIRNYVGDIERVVSGRGHRKAFLVTVPASQAIDPLLPISDHPNAGIFHARQQVWVHRDTNGRYGSPRVHAELRAQGRGARRSIRSAN